MTTILSVETHHASARHSDDTSLREAFEELRRNATLSIVLDAMPQAVAVLDENRQIVAANSTLLEQVAGTDFSEVIGARPGELLDCRNAGVGPGGCGTSEACRSCGAVNAVLSAQSGRACTKQCQITVKDTGEALDLSVTATPVQIEGRQLTVVSLRDVADEKRRKVLERTFFHDVLNSAGGALGVAQVLAEADSVEEVREYAPLLVFVMEQMIAEIQSQRDMLAAEAGDLSVQTEDVGTVGLLLEVLNTYASHPVREGRRLELAGGSSDRLLRTSKALLHRVLGNMVKNALEATAAGGTVRLGCDALDRECCFWVNNSDVMPQATQLQVFNRSFSTKGAGRGIGTYSIRLLGERYLGGRVSFDSTEESGTTFRIHLPLRHK